MIINFLPSAWEAHNWVFLLGFSFAALKPSFVSQPVQTLRKRKNTESLPTSSESQTIFRDTDNLEMYLD
jgi:hypothetical protein